MRLALRVALRRDSLSKMIIPDDIMDAARDGDIQTVVRFLDEGGDVNAFDAHGRTLLVHSVAHSQVELCRVLIARGADPNKSSEPDDLRWHGPLWAAAYYADGGLSNPRQGGGAAWSTSASGEIFQILMESGADVNVLSGLNLDNNLRINSVLGILLMYFGGRVQDAHSVSLEIVTTLVRAGARLESVVEYQASGVTYSASWCLDHRLAERPELGWDEHFIKARELIVGIQEDGSLKRFMRRPHRAVLRLRSLFSRDRAALKKWSPRGHDWHAIEFLVNPNVPNEVVWNILSFWRAST